MPPGDCFQCHVVTVVSVTMKCTLLPVSCLRMLLARGLSYVCTLASFSHCFWAALFWHEKLWIVWCVSQAKTQIRRCLFVAQGKCLLLFLCVDVLTCVQRARNLPCVVCCSGYFAGGDTLRDRDVSSS